MSASGNSFTLNLVDYGDVSHGLYVYDLKRALMPEMRVTRVPLAQADGSVSHGDTLGPRSWDLQCAIIENSTNSIDTLVDNIITALLAAHVAGPTTFYLDLWSGRSYQARPEGRIDSEVAMNGDIFTLRIVADDPTETVS